VPTAPSRSRLGWAPWAVAAIAVLAAAALAFVHFREKAPAPPQLMRFQILPPAKASFGYSLFVSPDGRKLAFSAPARDGLLALWIRWLDAVDSRVLAGTEGFDSGEPFWSPDSRYLAFGAGGKLKKIDVTGGPPQSSCDAGLLVIGSGWNRDGVIVFGTSNGGLRRVSAAGGTASPLTVLDSSRHEARHLLPSFLPDGRHFVYTRVSKESGIYVGSLDAKPEEQSSKPLLESQFGAVYAPTPRSVVGHLLFLRDGTMMAQPFDPGRLELTGDAVSVVAHVGSFANFGEFTVSDNGVLVYDASDAPNFQLTRLRPAGKGTGHGRATWRLWQFGALSGWNSGGRHAPQFASTKHRHLAYRIDPRPCHTLHI
jgi:eukaryotic-like serine/threonine-protein kinase